MRNKRIISGVFLAVFCLNTFLNVFAGTAAFNFKVELKKHSDRNSLYLINLDVFADLNTSCEIKKQDDLILKLEVNEAETVSETTEKHQDIYLDLKCPFNAYNFHTFESYAQSALFSSYCSKRPQVFLKKYISYRNIRI